MKDQGHLSDAQVQDKLREVRRRRGKQVESDLQTLMAHDWGRRFAYWLVHELCAIDGSSFAGAIKDGNAAAQHTAFREGRRSIGAALRAQFTTVATNDYLRMMDEQIRERAADLALEMTAKSAGDESQ